MMNTVLFTFVFIVLEIEFLIYYCGMKKCYVDRNFRVTGNLYDARGLLLQVNGKMEILILRPIGHDKNLSEAWMLMMDWGRRMYTGKSFNFPSVNACLLANYQERELPIVSCYTCSKFRNYGREDIYRAIDEYGKVIIAPEQAKNVYIAVTLLHDEFYHINPWLDLRSYQTKFPF